jgi:hypothetical protein
VLKHASQVLPYWPYAHDKFKDEVFTENALDWDEVVERMANPKMTRFTAMSVDEHVKTIEKSAQEALRAREEMIATEAEKAPLLALMQERGFPMTHDAWEMGSLMIEHAQ